MRRRPRERGVKQKKFGAADSLFGYRGDEDRPQLPAKVAHFTGPHLWPFLAQELCMASPEFVVSPEFAEFAGIREIGESPISGASHD
jgi:hypothetical protein